MNSSLIQILVLAAIAIFLVLKLRSILGSRDGFERSSQQPPAAPASVDRRGLQVIDGGPDRDITDHVTDGSSAAKALASMKKAEPTFVVTPFLQGARQAYEMILMAFEKGDIEQVRPFLAPEIQDSFDQVIEARKAQGLTIEANFIGLKEMVLEDATFDSITGWGELTVRFVGELTQAVRDSNGEIIEGDLKSIKRQRDVWTFARKMGAADPNWQLVATGE